MSKAPANVLFTSVRFGKADRAGAVGRGFGFSASSALTPASTGRAVLGVCRNL